MCRSNVIIYQNETKFEIYCNDKTESHHITEKKIESGDKHHNLGMEKITHYTYCDFPGYSKCGKHIQQLGLVPLYNNDDDFRLFCGMVDGLAFLPVPDLTNGIHLLRTLCPDSTYISGRLKQQNPAQKKAVRLVLRRSPPMFPPAIWNVHDATVNGDARTNNMCEGWNNNFFNLVGHVIDLIIMIH